MTNCKWGTGGSTTSFTPGPISGDGVRWQHDDGFQSWVPNSVAVGDFGAAAFAGLELNEARVSMYSGGSARPLYETLEPDSMDLWVDVDNEGTVEGLRTFYCNGLTAAPTNAGDVLTDDNQCPYISTGPIASSGTSSWLYATIVAVLGFGMALIIRDRGKKKA